MAAYQIIAFYCFTEIADPQSEVKRQKNFLDSLDVRARVYIAPNGINAQMSFSIQDGEKYLNWLKEDPRFAQIKFKIDPYNEHVLPKVTVKYRKQLAALDSFPDLQKGGEKVAAERWKQMLDERGDDTILIDVRNDYESVIGHFEGAECPDLKEFRDFPSYAESLKNRIDPGKTKVMMYCTGGIRCELYSALMKEKGFETIYQLDGGVIQYGKEVGNSHWKGKLFVFDDRLSVPISEDEHELISACGFCNKPTDYYFNCADMDCNSLFLSCPSCAEKMEGCCSEKCMDAERRRPFEKLEDGKRPKPFRKWYNYLKETPHKCCVRDSR